jgi:hypothetical protein
MKKRDIPQENKNDLYTDKEFSKTLEELAEVLDIKWTEEEEALFKIL